MWVGAPLVDGADADDASALFDDLTRLRVQSFVDDPSEGLAELGLAPPERVVEMALGDGAEGLRLEIGSADPEREGQRYARTDGQVMRIDDTLDGALERAAADWQSTSWTDLKVWEMDRLTIEEDGDSFELAKQAGEWRRGQEVISHSRVSDFLYALAGATAERLISVDEGRLLGAAVDSPVLRILVETGEGSEELTLLAPLEIGVPAQSAGRGYLALLAAATVEDLRAKLEDVRTAESPSDDGETPDDG